MEQTSGDEICRAGVIPKKICSCLFDCAFLHAIYHVTELYRQAQVEVIQCYARQTFQCQTDGIQIQK